jgi:alpha-1,2-mannosyltransferase
VPHHEFLVGILGSLFSPARGVFVYSPFLLLVVPGLAVAWRAAPPWVRYFAVGGVLNLLVTLWVLPFSGGNGFYSYRLPIETLFLAAPLLVLAYRNWTARTTLRRLLFAELLVVSLYLQALGAALYQRTSIAYPPWRSFLVIDTLRTVGFVGSVAFFACLVSTLAAVLVVMARRAGRERLPPTSESTQLHGTAVSTA